MFGHHDNPESDATPTEPEIPELRTFLVTRENPLQPGTTEIIAVKAHGLECDRLLAFKRIVGFVMTAQGWMPNVAVFRMFNTVGLGHFIDYEEASIPSVPQSSRIIAH